MILYSHQRDRTSAFCGDRVIVGDNVLQKYVKKLDLGF